MFLSQEEEAVRTQAELERRREETRIKEEETRRLQEELDQARIQMEENERALKEALETPRHVVVIHEHENGGEEGDDGNSELSKPFFLL